MVGKDAQKQNSVALTPLPPLKSKSGEMIMSVLNWLGILQCVVISRYRVQSKEYWEVESE